MKKYCVSLSFLLISLCLVGCDNNNNIEETEEGSLKKTFEWNGCENEVSNVNEQEYITIECENNKINIIHVGLSQNCCIDGLDTEVTLSNDTIYVTEFIIGKEECNCYCQYNTTLKIHTSTKNKLVINYTDTRNQSFTKTIANKGKQKITF